MENESSKLIMFLDEFQKGQNYYFFSFYGFPIDDILYINFDDQYAQAKLKDRYKLKGFHNADDGCIREYDSCYYGVAGEDFIEFSFDEGILFKKNGRLYEPIITENLTGTYGLRQKIGQKEYYDD